MKRITFRAEEDLIEKARAVALRHGTTLNAAFREWLADFGASDAGVQSYGELMKSLRYVTAGRHFSRDELNQR